MIGITSYGAYIPRLRMERTAMFEAMGWFAPALIMVAQGERSFCNHDEDSLTMAVAAARDCLAGLDKGAVTQTCLSSTTLPFLDRQNGAILASALNLRREIVTADFTSSLRAGTTGLLAALDGVRADEERTILVAATDKREARPGSFYEMWFGDGAASVLVGREGVLAEFLGSYSVSYDFVDHYRGAGKRFDYTWEERWARDEGFAKIVPEAVRGLFEKLKITMAEVDRFVFPCLFKAEQKAIARSLGASPEKVADNLHELCGETGAAHALLMFVSALEQAKPGERILLLGYGQGCDALYFRVTENINRLKPRRGVAGSLANRKSSGNYLKFLKFRGLIEPEEGIRGEAPTQTALSALWRKRGMILGLKGGRCTKCATAQFPRMDICVNPACQAAGTQEDYEFADRKGRIKTFTGDLLAVSDDPPAIYGMVQFDGGGRFMADFTDCELAGLKVGMPVAMSFRRRYVDGDRGFSGYFWKAVPLTGVAAIDEIRFDGRVAIVTGAGGGLGRAYALALAARGARVVVNDYGGTRDGSGEGSSQPANRVVEEIRSLGGQAVASYDSVASVQGGENIVKKALDAFGRVDILINNAGILRDKSAIKMEEQDWKAVLDVHLDGAYHVTRPAFRAMREGGYGRIVMTTSASGLYGNFGQSNYSAAKMALAGMMNTLKLEGQKYNIKVNTVAPTAASRLTEDIMPPEVFQRLSPDYVTPLVMYLASERCEDSGFIVNTGAGYVSRAAILTGPGTKIGDGQRIPTVEDIRDDWEKINRISPGKEYVDAGSAIVSLLTTQGQTPEQPQAALPEPGGVGEVFRNMAANFRAEAAAGLDLIFEFQIAGPGGGDWSVTIRDGACRVEEGRAARATTTIIMADEDFLKLLTGELDGMKAFGSGKLKVEGDLMKAQLIGKLFKIKKP